MAYGIAIDLLLPGETKLVGRIEIEDVSFGRKDGRVVVVEKRGHFARFPAFDAANSVFLCLGKGGSEKEVQDLYLIIVWGRGAMADVMEIGSS